MDEPDQTNYRCLDMLAMHSLDMVSRQARTSPVVRPVFWVRMSDGAFDFDVYCVKCQIQLAGTQHNEHSRYYILPCLRFSSRNWGVCNLYLSNVAEVKQCPNTCCSIVLRNISNIIVLSNVLNHFQRFEVETMLEQVPSPCFILATFVKNVATS